MMIILEKDPERIPDNSLIPAKTLQSQNHINASKMRLPCEVIIRKSSFPEVVFSQIFGTHKNRKLLTSQNIPKTSYSLQTIVHAVEERFVASVINDTTKEEFALKFTYDPFASPDYELDLLKKLKDKQYSHILYPIDYGKLPSIGYFMVFPFIKETTPPQDFPYIWRYLYQIALAIKACHDCNIIHRDIKEKNFLYSEDGNVWLIDFESAVEGPENDDPMLFGTVPYWSSEVCEGDWNANTFARDMWALGVLIFKVVYRNYPFNIDPIERINCEITSTLKQSIEAFLAKKQDKELPWSYLVHIDDKNFHNHIVIQKLLKGLFKWKASSRMSATEVVKIIKTML